MVTTFLLPMKDYDRFVIMLQNVLGHGSTQQMPKFFSGISRIILQFFQEISDVVVVGYNVLRTMILRRN